MGQAEIRPPVLLEGADTNVAGGGRDIRVKYGGNELAYSPLLSYLLTLPAYLSEQSAGTLQKRSV